jgi:hypothetical protein
MMAGSLEARLLFLILLGSGALGLFVRALLSEAHRNRETTDFVQLVVTMLVTFVAVVLGLLTSSAKASFDQVGNELKRAQRWTYPARPVTSSMGRRDRDGAPGAA